jgi:hypothetical protein
MRRYKPYESELNVIPYTSKEKCYYPNISNDTVLNNQLLSDKKLSNINTIYTHENMILVKNILSNNYNLDRMKYNRDSNTFVFQSLEQKLDYKPEIQSNILNFYGRYGRYGISGINDLQFEIVYREVPKEMTNIVKKQIVLRKLSGDTDIFMRYCQQIITPNPNHYKKVTIYGQKTLRASK